MQEIVTGYMFFREADTFNYQNNGWLPSATTEQLSKK